MDDKLLYCLRTNGGCEIGQRFQSIRIALFLYLFYLEGFPIFEAFTLQGITCQLKFNFLAENQFSIFERISKKIESFVHKEWFKYRI